MDYFRTTTKGYLQFNQLPAQFVLRQQLYMNSFYLQMLILIIYVWFFVFTLYRISHDINTYEPPIKYRQQLYLQEITIQKTDNPQKKQSRKKKKKKLSLSEKHSTETNQRAEKKYQQKFNQTKVIREMHYEQLFPNQYKTNAIQDMVKLESRIIQFLPLLTHFIINNNVFAITNTSFLLFLCTVAIFVGNNVLSIKQFVFRNVHRLFSIKTNKNKRLINALLQKSYFIPILVQFGSFFTQNHDLRM